nr:NAD(P)/FAD-dependent oxidoreductase [Vallitaleaceae bacterium]
MNTVKDNKKNIVVLGAGYGGILTAKKLARKFKKNEDITITLIDKNSYHTMLTELHEVAAGRVPEDAIRINLDKVFAGRKVNIVLDEVLNIDFDEKVLKGKVAEYEYDYLVLGTGSKPTFYGCVGAAKHSLTLWSYEDAIRIKSHIWEMMGKASVETDPVKRASYLTFIVIGCGFTGIEMIGELAEWRKSLCHTFNIDEEEVKLYVVDMLPKVLPMFKDKLILKTEKRLAKMGVEILTSTNITEVRKDAVCIEGRECIQTHTSIWAAGVEGSDIMETLDVEKKGRNRVQTDSKLRLTQHDNVFAVGDNIFFIPEGEDRPLPQMVEIAEHSSALV